MSLWFLLAYLSLQVAISYWVGRRIRSEADYFVAGRRLGTPLVAVSMFATWFGAESCLGSSGAIYEQGLSGGRADPFGYALCLLLMGAILVRRLWASNVITLADLFRKRYGRRVERLVVLVLVPSSLIWGAAQVRAFGQVLSATMDMDVTFAIYTAAAFVTAYTLIGGLLGDVLTDFIQGIIVAVGLFLILGITIAELGGFAALPNHIEPERLSLVSAEDGWLSQLDRFCIPVLGSLVAQELISRAVAARNEQVAVKASYFSAGIYLLVGLSPVLLGLLGPSLVPGLEDPEQLLPTLAERLLPSALYAVFACALLAAILSTIDSILLASSALIAHNVVVPLLGVKEERIKVRWARGMVLATGVVALVIALHAEGIYDLVETASAFGTAGVLVTTLTALFWKRGGTRAATAALLTGLVATPVAEYWLELEAPFLSAIAASFGVYVLVSFAPPERAPALAP